MSSDSPDQVTVHEVNEYGLLLPDGREVWPPETISDEHMQTAQSRCVVQDKIVTSLNNMSLPLEDTLIRYRWITRTVKQYVTTTVEDRQEHDLCSPEILTDPDDIFLAEDHVDDGELAEVGSQDQ